MTRGGGNSNQRLSSKNPWAYLGNNSYQPPEFVTETVAPTTEDAKNFSLGTVWLVIPEDSGGTDPVAEDIYFLVKTYDSSGDPNGAWVNLSFDVIEMLTGNSGGIVSPDGNDNINLVGDGTTITIVGDPGTNTLTMSTSGTSVSSTLTGDSGGAVGPTAGNIDVVGSGVITVAGNPGTSTLTVTPDGSIASSFITSPATGTAIPDAGVLTFAGTGGITVTSAGSTVTIDESSVLSTLTGDSGGAVGFTAGNIDIVGSGVITVVGNPGASSLTITPSGDIASSFITNPATGTAIPDAGVLTFAGTGGITVTNAGSTATIDGAAIVEVLNSFTADDANTVTEAAGIINISGGSNVATTGTSGPNTLTVNLDGITQYSVQVGGSSNALTQIVNGTTGEVLTANTGADPSWSTSSVPDYEQSTFTPVLKFGGGTTGITYDEQHGYFIRIEKTVFYNIYIKLTSKGSSTGSATITGFPYNAQSLPPFWDSSIMSGVGAGTFSLSSGFTNAWLSVRNTGLVAFTRESGSGVTQKSLTNTSFNDTSEFRVQGFYGIP